MLPFNFNRLYLSLAVLLTVLMQTPAQAVTPVRLYTVNWIGYAPLYIAYEKDLFAAHGVKMDMTIVAENPLMVEALKTGKADAITPIYAEALTALAEGVDLKIVMPIDYSNGGDAILAPKTLPDIKALKGKKVGVNFLAPQDVLLTYALQQNGMSEADITPVNLPAEDVQGELESAKIDAGVSYEPNVSTILGLAGGQKYHVVYSSKEAPGLITDTLAFSSSFIQAQPEAVRGVILAYLDGLKFLREQADESAKILSITLGISKAEVPQQLATVYWPELAEMSDVFKPGDDPRSFFVSGQLINDMLLKKGAISAPVSIEGSFDASFINTLAAGK